MKYPSLLVMACIFTLCIQAGCGSSGPKAGSSGSIPDWVMNTPTNSAYIYSVGISGRTFYPTDAIKYATENARREMAGMVRTKVLSMTKTHDSTRRDDISIDSIAVTDEDLQGSEVKARWIDKKGASGVAPGTTYVLLQIERGKFEQLIKKYQ